MKKILNICLDANEAFSSSIENTFDGDCLFLIKSDKDKSFNYGLSNEDIEKMMNHLDMETSNVADETYSDDPELRQFTMETKAQKKAIAEELKKLNVNQDNILDIIDEIIISDERNNEYTLEDQKKLLTYLRNNTHYFNGKQVTIRNKSYELDYENYYEAYNLCGFIPNVKIHVDWNRYPVTFDQYKKIIDVISKIAERIQDKDYSPLEKLIYLYDIVRDRIYNEEDANEKSNVSRDLSEVLFGDKIVCVGFANIFNAVAKSLHINAMEFNMKDKNSIDGHARSLIYLKDEKYKIDSLYFFDPTWDAKKDETNNHFKSFLFFGRTPHVMKKIDDRNNLEYESYLFPTLEEIDDLYKCLKNENDDFKKRIILLSRKFAKGIRAMSNLLDIELIETLMDAKQLSSDEEIYEWFKYVNEKSINVLNPISLIKALYKVRRDENLETPEKFEFDKSSFIDTIYNSKIIPMNIELLRILAKTDKDLEILCKMNIESIINDIGLTFEDEKKMVLK